MMRRPIRIAIYVAGMVSVFGLSAGAQKACKVDSAARWFVKQREWLDDSKATWSNDTLRTWLVRAAHIESGKPLSVQMGWEIEEGVVALPMTGESAVISQLQALASTRGSVWPTKSVVGASGVRAVWLLAHVDTALTRSALKRMMEAGPEESNAADVATLEDRLRLQSGRKQIYGTQFRVGAGGKLVLAPMEDSAHVDLRREDAGLPAFTMSACLAQKAASAKK
jgi:hypothetical protein